MIMRITCIVFAAVLTGGCATRAPSGDTAAVLQELDGFHARFDTLYRRGDAIGVAQMLTDSVVISPIEAPDLKGRGTLQGLLAGYFAADSVAEYRLQIRELEVYGNVAHARGDYVWRSGPRGQPGTQRLGRFSAEYQRGADGRWRMHRLLENLLPG